MIGGGTPHRGNRGHRVPGAPLRAKLPIQSFYKAVESDANVVNDFSGEGKAV